MPIYFHKFFSDSITLVKRDYVTLRERKNAPKRFLALLLLKV
ncbi:hypothetical protein LEP1GSC165_2064 [Leptospira santarosai str. CBC523]|nr:hypothetical protein LSS_21695 [Leptospira santarosai serovar Shermani str. LT 821]EMM78902.1 hypothetical protein LEP1GSC040_2162 [Leptospira santarosai str. 2000030832]EMO12872.1 hypothetical protein LEP1GSC165_2064 [Leptospira santarosai str. CBC523]EMO46195.1 hypothetical protein LEP1GSC187_1846 [Leptospira santarosai str. ZUN179]EPG83102.1 hypothetical protein LEP1GSC048_0329 [Leptospira santarosai serovar Shermani str. 1342KT]